MIRVLSSKVQDPRQMKVHLQDLCSDLYHSISLLVDVEDNQEERNSGIQSGFMGLWCCGCHFLLKNASCMTTVSEAESALTCEATWFPGWKIKRPWWKNLFPRWASVSMNSKWAFCLQHAMVLWFCVRPGKGPFSVPCPGGRKLGSRRPISFPAPTGVLVLGTVRWNSTTCLHLTIHPSQTSLDSISSGRPSMIIVPRDSQNSLPGLLQ